EVKLQPNYVPAPQPAKMPGGNRGIVPTEITAHGRTIEL
ncbi:MAG: hypothetical protein JWL69_4690, partial [Phycisphaerales bacterium]|nr:hypothetical protein [Phycisphaerales bacterium]